MIVQTGQTSIPFPKPVRSVMGLYKFSVDVGRAIKALANRVDTVQVPRRSGGSGVAHPFKLSVSTDGDVYNWNVSSTRSTITDGTNGIALTITNLDTDTAFTEEKYIVVRSTVTSLVLGTVTVIAVDDPEEVLTSGTPVEQDTIQLLIGKVDVVDEAPTKEQYLLHAARLTYGFLSGKLVRVFEAAPIHQGNPPPP